MNISNISIITIEDSSKSEEYEVLHIADIDPEPTQISNQYEGNPCPQCGDGKLIKRNNKNGGWFLGCSEFPKCKYCLSSIRFINY